MSRPIDYDPERIKEMYKAGTDITDIAEAVGCSVKTVRRTVTLAGLIPGKQWSEGQTTLGWQEWFSIEWTEITDFLKEQFGKDESTGQKGTEETKGKGACV